MNIASLGYLALVSAMLASCGSNNGEQTGWQYL